MLHFILIFSFVRCFYCDGHFGEGKALTNNNTLEEARRKYNLRSGCTIQSKRSAHGKQTGDVIVHGLGCLSCKSNSTRADPYGITKFSISF